jgi:hypothetical protein
VAGYATVTVIEAILAIEIDKNNINFGTFSVGQVSATETVTATNTGTINIDLSVILGTFTNGTNYWNIAPSPGADTCCLLVGTTSTTLKEIEEYNKEYLMYKNLPKDNSVIFYLKLKLPTYISRIGRYDSLFIITASPAE